jgi:hypothetical protein
MGLRRNYEERVLNSGDPMLGNFFWTRKPRMTRNARRIFQMIVSAYLMRSFENIFRVFRVIRGLRVQKNYEFGISSVAEMSCSK